MLEYDLDSWHRKWKGCAGILKKEDGTLFQGFYQNIEGISEQQFMAVLKKDGKFIMGNGLIPVPIEFKGMPYAMPVYRPFESGVYHSRADNGHRVVMVKIHNKSFSVGVHGHTYGWWGYTKEGHDLGVMPEDIDLLSPLALDEFDPGKMFGALSKKIWWVKDQFMWMQKQIGFIQGWNIILDNDFYLPFIQPLVGEKCQLSVL
jgi:hypothetical protein